MRKKHQKRFTFRENTSLESSKSQKLFNQKLNYYLKAVKISIMIFTTEKNGWQLKQNNAQKVKRLFQLADNIIAETGVY